MLVTLDRQKILGVGGFGTVFEGAWRGVKVAVKRIPIEKAASNEQEEKALKMLNHTNVIKLFHVQENQDFRMFVLELCDASLDRLFLQENDPKKYSGPMPPETEVLLQLAKGLAYIHQMGLVHRDIKPQNVLISLDSTTQQVVMKWADFGFSKQVNERGTFTMSGVRGTYDYFAPEILKLLDEDSSSENEAKRRGTVKSDVFAEGLVFGYFLLGGIHPFGSSSYEIGKNIRTKKPTNLPQTGKIHNIIIEMLEKEPDNRITSSDVVDRFTNILKNSQQMFTLLAGWNPNVEEIGKLIQEGVEINAKDEKGLTPLLRLAVSIQTISLVGILSLLFQHGAKINSVASNGKNALLLWVKNREQHRNKSFLATIYLFVEKGIDVNCKDKDGNNALTLLCANYKKENLIAITRLLIERGIDIHCKNEYGDNALTLLCGNYENENLIDIIQLFVEKGIDINCKDKYGENALIKLYKMYFKNEYFIEITRLLIEKGIDINCKDKYGENALTKLCERCLSENLIDIIGLLIEKKIDINWKNQNGDNALTLLCKHYYKENLIDLIQLLIQNGIAINWKNEDENNALTLLCANYINQNIIDIIRLLIEKGIDVNCNNHYGDNALTLLCENYQRENLIDIIRVLIENRIDINCKNKYGDNALTTLCENYRNENLIAITRLLIEKGIDINCKDKYGENALTLLCYNYENENLIDIIQLLIEKGIDINCKDKFGRISLILLCENDRNENLIDIIRLLIERGIDINCKDMSGENVLINLCLYYKNEKLIDVINLVIISGFNVTKETLDYFQRNYKGKNRNEVLQLLDSATNHLNNVSWCYLF